MSTETITFLTERYARERVTVKYTPRSHWRGDLKAYDVTVGGEPVGYVEQAVESTDRHYGRIRVPGRGRIAWGWRKPNGEGHSPGLYERTRREAVGRLLGYRGVDA